MIDNLPRHPFAGSLLAAERPGCPAANRQTEYCRPPISYRRANMIVVSLLASIESLQTMVPRPLRVRRMYGPYGCLALQFVQMPETSLGPYQECVASVVCDDHSIWSASDEPAGWRPPPCYPLWISVTTATARDCGQRYWGFPKVLAETGFRALGDRVVGTVHAQSGLDIRLSTPIDPGVEDCTVQIRSFTEMVGEIWKTDIRGQARISQLNDVEVELHFSRRTSISCALGELGVLEQALSVVYVEGFDFELPEPFACEARAQ